MPIKAALGSFGLTSEGLQRELRTSREELFMPNMTNHASAFITRGPNFSDFSNPNNNPFRLSGSSYQYKPHYKVDHPEVGLRILINSLTDDDHETKPFAGGVLFEPSKSKKIIFGPQVKMIMNIPPSSGSSPRSTFPVPGSNMVPPPFIGGSNAVYGVGEPSGSVPTRLGSNLEGSSAIKPISLLPVVPTRPNHAIHESSLTSSQTRVSEEYSTLVISHPPFPKMTRIFGDRVVECHPCKFLDSLEEERLAVKQRHHQVANFSNCSNSYPFSPYFLRICYTCKRQLKGQDIYIYRGDSSFCSEECRFEEMLAERMEKTVTKTAIPKSHPTSSKNEAIFFLGNTTLPS